jgi:F-type H+-transporting ATPase subunit b
VDINMTLIGQGITFFIFIMVTLKYVWPPIQKALIEREAKITDGLAAAEKAQKDLAEAEQRSAEILSEGKQKAADIISQAQKRGDELVDEAKQDARSEGERLIASAHAEIEQEISAARDKLRNEVAVLALAGAEQILQREVDRKVHDDVLDKICAKL